MDPCILGFVSKRLSFEEEAGQLNNLHAKTKLFGKPVS